MAWDTATERYREEYRTEQLPPFSRSIQTGPVSPEDHYREDGSYRWDQESYTR